MESIEKLRVHVATRSMNLHDKDVKVNGKTVLDALDAIEDELSEKYMLLPVDADGVPIHVYDRLLKSTGAQKPTYGEVVGISDDSIFFSEKQGWSSSWASLTRHVKPDPVKKLLGRMADEVYDDSQDIPFDRDFIVEKYADKLRELLGEAMR